MHSPTQVYPYTTNEVVKMVGNGISRGPIQRWFHKGAVRGAVQREKNAQILLSADGVVEAWYMWAASEGLDPQGDMPEPVRALLTQVANQADDNSPFVRIEVSPGVRVEVVQRA